MTSNFIKTKRLTQTLYCKHQKKKANNTNIWMPSKHGKYMSLANAQNFCKCQKNKTKKKLFPFLFGPADFWDIVVFSQVVQVAIEILQVRNTKIS